jgi:hypothetical protein
VCPDANSAIRLNSIKMKSAKIIIISLITIVMSLNSYARIQNGSKIYTIKSEVLKVSGNCEMCKARIEKAAMMVGVSRAEWEPKTRVLSLTYDSAKTNIGLIAKGVAAAGHDNGMVRAADSTYNILPGCCKYR